MSQAAGFSGTPRNRHTSIARQKASWTTSSASARLWTPKIRVSAATRRPYSRRNRCSLSSIGRSEVQLLDGSDLDGPAALEDRASPREFDGLVDVRRLDERESADEILGFGVRPVGHGL